MNTTNNNEALDVKAKITWINDDPQSSRKAAATITVGDVFTVRGLSVMNGSKGLFVSMPQRKTSDHGTNKYVDIAYPVTAAMRQKIIDTVTGAYKQALAQRHGNIREPRNVPSSPVEADYAEQEDDNPFLHDGDSMDMDLSETDNCQMMGCSV